MDGDGHDALVERIREAMTAGVLVRDGRLPPERSMAETLGVSRAKLRRALDRLERDGILYRRQGQGTFAAPPLVSDTGRLARLARAVTPRDVMEVRLEIEPALASLAADRADAADLRQLRQMMDATRHLAQQAAYEAADDILHYRIAVAARNSLFLQVYESIRAVRKLVSWTRSREISHSEEIMARFGHQHMEVFLAIQARDMIGASEAMEHHLMNVARVLSRSVRRPGTSDGRLPGA